jgi:hypothetical protein
MAFVAVRVAVYSVGIISCLLLLTHLLFSPNPISSDTVHNAHVTTSVPDCNRTVEKSIDFPAPLLDSKNAIERPNFAPAMKIFPQACNSSVLLGNEHHGGWYICKEYLPVKNNDCVVYSYGLGADWSFDNAVEKLGCHVHGFDPSGLLWRQGMHGKDYAGIDYVNQYPSKLKTFHNWGIGVVSKALYASGTVPQEWPGLGDPQLSKSNSEPWELRSIEQTMIDLGHKERSISILKIDVEGAEWDSLTAFFECE